MDLFSFLIESSNVLIAGGNMSKKVVSGGVCRSSQCCAHGHFFLGCRSWSGFSGIACPCTRPNRRSVRRRAAAAADVGFALLVSALTVPPRPERHVANADALFATPISIPPGHSRQAADHEAKSSCTSPWPIRRPVFPQNALGQWKWLIALAAASVGFFLFAYFVFDRLRDSFAEEV